MRGPIKALVVTGAMLARPFGATDARRHDWPDDQMIWAVIGPIIALAGHGLVVIGAWAGRSAGNLPADNDHASQRHASGG